MFYVLFSIIQAAAENIRPAFESTQSIVQSFFAVGQMLTSTSNGMHMYFQAVLGVAENFSRLRTCMMKMHSTFVSLKLVRWFLTKLIYLISKLIVLNYEYYTLFM